MRRRSWRTPHSSLCMESRRRLKQPRKPTLSQHQAQGASIPCCIYDPEPSHIWNRLHRTLLIREDLPGTNNGADSLDPLFWSTTKYLLVAPSHKHAMSVLDEFLQVHAETMIHDPIKRAILQRDLWAVFDWSVERQSVKGDHNSFASGVSSQSGSLMVYFQQHQPGSPIAWSEDRQDMLKSLARAAGFLAYFLITLEMIFMITPFALYYYSAYAPFLSGASRFHALAWLPAFFLPHLSTDIVPSVGGLILLVGLVGFLVGAFQIYYAKFRQRGVVTGGFYKRVRHPQYLFLAIAGLGLLIVWPRFILLIVYLNMLWFYYLLARSEEERMRSRYGDAYLAPMRDTPMFLPGEPGRHLSQLLFGSIPGRRLRLSLIYCVSLVAAIGAAFALRQLSLTLTTHLNLPGERIAAVSFLSTHQTQLRQLIQLAEADPQVQGRLNHEDGWMLVEAAETKASATHVLIDAGMTLTEGNRLPLSTSAIKLVFLRRKDHGDQNPFATGARWQPTFIAEVDDHKVSRVLDLPETLFHGNPVPPTF